MSHPESEHGLRVQLATALRERDEARAFANGEVAHLTTLRAKQDAELVSTRESLAAARRECELLREMIAEHAKCPDDAAISCVAEIVARSAALTALVDPK